MRLFFILVSAGLTLERNDKLGERDLWGSCMHVLVLRPRLRRSVDDEEAGRIYEAVIPLYEGSGGFRALYGVRLGDRELMGISFWDSREDAERGFEAARPRMVAAYGGVLDGPPERTSGELHFAYRVDQGASAD
jgi:heme-degrading monooxygenase HmoA